MLDFLMHRFKKKSVGMEFRDYFHVRLATLSAAIYITSADLSQTDFEQMNLNNYNLMYLIAFEILIFTYTLN